RRSTYSTLSRCLRLTPSGRWTTYWQRRISATYRMVFTRRSTRIPSLIFESGSTPIRHPEHKRSLTKSKKRLSQRKHETRHWCSERLSQSTNEREWSKGDAAMGNDGAYVALGLKVWKAQIERADKLFGSL